MKKVFFMAALAALMVSCSSGQKQDEAASEPAMETTTSTDTDSGAVTEEATETDSEATTGEEASASEDWDAVLDEYESFIDQYLKLYKKAQAGDASALSEYASMLEKAESLGKKLENAEDELTPAQAKRMVELQQKLTSGLM